MSGAPTFDTGKKTGTGRIYNSATPYGQAEYLRWARAWMRAKPGLPVIQRKQTRENVCGLCLNANSCSGIFYSYSLP